MKYISSIAQFIGFVYQCGQQLFGGTRGIDARQPGISCRVITLVVAAFLAMGIDAAHAAQDELRIARSDGIGYIPLILMEKDHLIEQKARAAGLGEIKVSWLRFTGGAELNDALLSGSLDLASGGVPPFLLLWSKTKGTPVSVKAVSALAAYPYLLVSKNPNVHTIKDLSDKDRIALPGVKVSIQAVLLQMAAARAFGNAQYAQLDPLTVSLANPDGLIALTNGVSGVTALFSNPPFQYQALRQNGVHTILNSYDVLGGPSTSTFIWTTEKFHREKPKLYAVFVAALEEAKSRVRADERSAVVLYKTETKDPESVDRLVSMVNDIDYSSTPKNTMQFVNFMQRVGTLKVVPESWKDLFFPEMADQPGS